MSDLPPDGTGTRNRQGFLSIVQAEVRPFSLHPIHFPDPAKIPPRQWIYGRQLIRGFVTLLVAPGGTGKSSLLLGNLLSVAIGRPLLGVPIHQQCKTALLNLEDPQEEIDRRLAALAQHFGLSNDELRDRFYMSEADRAVTIASVDGDGFGVVYPDERAIIERVRDEKIGVLGVDPFAESHTLEENSNPQMIQAAAAWRRVARLGNCAVVLAHHVRKGQVLDIEAARGAKALTDSARIGLLLSSMPPEDAADLGIREADRLSYVRLDDAKANLSPRGGRATWFHLARVNLNNGTPEYPYGDEVVAIEAWSPPSVWEGLTDEGLNQALDVLEAGLPGGGRFTDARKSADRWAGTVLINQFSITQGQASAMLKAWLASGLLTKEAYRDNGQRKDRIGLSVNNLLRPGTRVG